MVAPDPSDADAPAWHRALAYALTGEDLAHLGRQPRPELSALLSDLERHLPGGLEGLRRDIGRRRAAGQPWPFPVPAGVRRGIGAARFLAVRQELVEALTLPPAQPQATVRSRPLTPEERQLADDVPPHH